MYVFTDDYIIGRTSSSPIAYLRQCMLKRKIRRTLPITKELYVISDEMKEAYSNLFGVNSYIIRNFSVEREKIGGEKQANTQPNCLTMVYAGGLHYNRWKVLSQIAIALKEINQIEKYKCCLKVYSSQNVSDEIIEKINIEGVSEFCGAASASQISAVYAGADILLHVESFEKKAIASTKYSFSTKIPEYLSASKCVVAVGPSDVASIRYLKHFACVISDSEKLLVLLTEIINDSQYRGFIKSKCEEQYKKDFSRKRQEECLERILHV